MSQLADLRWMLPPLAMCLVLMGMHGYLGLHVISRKVIFVDLALAQIAALGSVYALLLGFDAHDSPAAVYAFSLGFTFVGAAVFALARMRRDRVPQEAFIGIVYATASALALLLLAKSPGEGEHIKEMLVGNVLLTTWPAVARTAAVYAAIGAFHYAFHERFLEISADPDAAAERGVRVRLWDFLFYASFGLVITLSVRVAGVLLVFSFLVVPAVVAFLFQERTWPRILVAWGVGTACSAAGMLVSYYGDLPTGPSVVACFAGLLVLAALFYYLRAAARRGAALLRVAAGGAALLALVLATRAVRGPPDEHGHEGEYATYVAELDHPEESVQLEAVHHLAMLEDPHAVEPLLALLARTGSERVQEHVVRALPELGEAARAAVPALREYAARDADPFLRLEAARSLLRLQDASGFAVIARLLDEDPPVLVERQAGELLAAMAGSDFGVGRASDDVRRAEARGRLKAWLAERGDRLRWRADLKRFD